MATPAVTREHTLFSCSNSRKTIFPARCEMRPDSSALCAEQFLVSNQTGKEPDLLDGTTEIPPEIPHRSRRTLMSLQECQIARGSPNQLKMMTDSPAIGFRAIPHSSSYRTSGLTSFGQLQRFPETPVSSL